MKWSILANIHFVLEKTGILLLIDGVFYKCIWQRRLIVLLKSSVSLLIIHIYVLSVIERGLLKSLAIAVNLSISHCGSIRFCFLDFKVVY